MADVVLDGVVMRYDGGHLALPKLDLHIKSGELCVLVGPSGCGKSTTLRLIAGLEQPSEGEIRIDGRRVNEVAPSDRDIAMVFQSYALYPHMTVRENLAFGLKMRKTPAAEIETRVREAAELLGIAELLARTPKQLSGGQRQRVAMGRAIVRRPKVFLFDEPLSNLDAQLRGQVRREIGALCARLETTSVYVTHDQAEAMTLADRIVVMQGGVIQQVGTPLEIYDAPANVFVATFLGSPTMNLVSAELAGAELRAPGLAVGADLDRVRARGKVVVGIRPHHLSVGAPDGAGATLRGHVRDRELHGGEAFVHVEAECGTLLVRTEAHAAPAKGASVGVTVDPGHLHLFDASTGLRLEAAA